MFVTITTRTERVRVLPLFSLCLFICVRLIINRLNLIVLNFYFSFIGKKKQKYKIDNKYLKKIYNLTDQL